MQRTEVFDLIKEFAGQSNILTVPVAFIRYAGSLEAALLLSQILYWSDKTQDGWFYKTYKEWDEEIALGEYDVRKASKSLKEKGILETRLKKANGAPTVHYRLKEGEFSESILQYLKNPFFNNSRNLDSSKSEESLTKTTNRLPTKKRAPAEIRPPFSGTKFTDTLAAFEIHRKEIGKTLRPTGRKALYAQLESLGEVVATEALETSIARGWTGVFPPDAKPHSQDARLGLTPNGQKILSDDGDRYTVMGADGTPSKRWRTPEAFAQDTGRDLEEVRAHWN